MSTKSALSRPIVYDDALLTSIVRYGESDCIVRMFTKNSGRIAAFFKRGMAMKKGVGGVQAPVFSHVGLIENSHKLAQLVSSDLDPSTVLPTSIKAFGYRAYVAEVIEKLVPEGEPAPQLFTVLEDVFEAFLHHGAKPATLRAFELKLLDWCGYLPELPLGVDTKAFEPMGSRFLPEHEEGSFSFSHDAVKLARAMLIAKVGSISYEGPELLMIGRVFHYRLKTLGLWPLKSVDFLRQLSGRKR